MTKGLIVFDVDGVLLQSELLYSDIAQKCFNHRISEHDMGTYVTKGGQALFDAVAGRRAERVDIEKFRAAQVEMFDATRHLYNNVEETLSELANKNWLAIVSNKPENIIHQILKHGDLGDHFFSIVGLDSGFKPKPEPDGINYVKSLRKYSRLVYVGDAYSDFVAAKAASAEFVYCSYGFDFDPREHELCADTFEDLKDILV